MDEAASIKIALVKIFCPFVIRNKGTVEVWLILLQSEIVADRVNGKKTAGILYGGTGVEFIIVVDSEVS